MAKCRQKAPTKLESMTSRSIVLDVFEDALGVTPSAIVTRGRELGAAELTAVMNARITPLENPRGRPDLAHQIWPLMSHHTYGARALFGSRRRDILPRALTLLFLHDGLVVADPLESVYQTRARHSEADAVRVFNRVVSELAEVEPLIEAGVLRFTALRPALQDAHRAAVLRAMGLQPDLRVFTDFLEAAASVSVLPGSLQRTYAPQVRDLHRRFGLDIQIPATVELATERVRALAAAVIEVSWQFAVAALDPTCDLAFVGRMERHLAEALVEDGMSASLGAGRHTSTLELGGLPNLDTARLSVSDALAIRQEDAFESFRFSVRKALDQLEVARNSGVSPSSARGAFEEAMREESRALRETSKRATFRDRLKAEALPAALGVTNQLAVAPLGSGYAAGASGGISLLNVIWQWLRGRHDSIDQAVCQRYLSILGGS